MKTVFPHPVLAKATVNGHLNPIFERTLVQAGTICKRESIS
jgi:hypothetical protein